MDPHPAGHFRSLGIGHLLCKPIQILDVEAAMFREQSKGRFIVNAVGEVLCGQRQAEVIDGIASSCGTSRRYRQARFNVFQRAWSPLHDLSSSWMV